MANTELKVRITGDLTAIRNSLAALQGDLVKLDQRVAKIGTNGGGFGKLENSIGRIRTAVVGLAASLGAGLSVAGLIAVSDQAALINARLKLATKSQQEFNRAQQELFGISQRTRTDLQSTVDLYSRLERSTRQLGLNQSTLLQLTDTISKTSTLSGGGPAVEAALQQFGQLLSAGDLSAAAQEINSIQEQAPRLAEAIKTGLREMGFEGSNSLKKLVSEGGVQVEDLLKAILSQTKKVDSEFAQLPATIGGGFTQIKNAFTQYLATSKEAGSNAEQVAKALKAVADNLPAIINGFIALAKVVAAYLITFRALPALYTGLIALSGGLATANLTLAASFTAAQTAGAKAFLAIRIAAGALLAFFAGWQLGTFLQEEFLQVKLAGIALVSGLMTEFTKWKGAVLNVVAIVKAAFVGVFNYIREGLAARVNNVAAVADAFGLDGIAEKARNVSNSLKPAKSAFEDLKDTLKRNNAETEAEVKRIAAEFDDLADAAIAARQKTEGTGAAGEVAIPAGGGNAEDEAKKLKAFYDQNLDLLLDATQRAIKELDRLYEAGEIGMQQYFAEKTRLELQAVDAQIAQARGELALADNRQDQEKILANIIKLERDRAEIAPRAARDQAAAEKELTRALEDVEARLADLNGGFGERARLDLERERDELLKKFRDNPGAQGLVNQLFDTELANSRANAIRSKASSLVSELRAQTDYLNNQSQLGGLSPFESERQLQAARQTTLDQLIAIRDAAQQAYNQKPTPETLAALREVDTAILDIQASQNTLRNNAKSSAFDALNGFFNDLATGAKSFKDAFKDMVVNFIQGLARMAAEALSKQIIGTLFGVFAPGPGLGVGVNHGGGMAGHGMRRIVNPLVFAGAPRFHSGGMAGGVKPGEVPAILQTGERVLSRSETAKYNAGDRASPGTRIVNVFDPSFVTDAMDSAEGERVVFNHIGRNPGRLKQLLA